MQKIKMARETTQTFEEGCNKYLENCRQRNLREGTALCRVKIEVLTVCDPFANTNFLVRFAFEIGLRYFCALTGRVSVQPIDVGIFDQKLSFNFIVNRVVF